MTKLYRKAIGANLYRHTPEEQQRRETDRLKLINCGGLDTDSGWTFAEEEYGTFDLLTVYELYEDQNGEKVLQRPDCRTVTRRLALDSEARR